MLCTQLYSSIKTKMIYMEFLHPSGYLYPKIVDQRDFRILMMHSGMKMRMAKGCLI